MKVGLYCQDMARPNGMSKSTLLAAGAFRHYGHDVEILAETAASPARRERLFGPLARGLRVEKVGPPRGAAGRRLAARTAGYDLFINQLPGAYFPSLAPRSWLWVHAVPLTAPRYPEYYRVLGNSRYTLSRLASRWKTKGELLHPPVGVRDFAPRRKEKLLLTVGTLGGQARPKNELALIRLFKQLRRQDRLPGWRYHIAGALEGGEAWVRKLRAEAAGLPVRVQVDASLADLQDLYGRAAMLWHGCGASVSARKPEGLEHFGIALVEAMAAGCVPLAPDAGGPREIIEHGKTGWLYRSVDRLGGLTVAVAGDERLRKRLALGARARSRCYGTDVFRRRLRALLASADHA